MKNLLLIIQNLSNGGAERAITMLANTLKDDYNVTMVTFDNTKKEYFPEVNIIDLKIPESSNLVKKMFNFFIRIQKVKKIKKELNIEGSISYLSGPNIVNCLSRQNDKVIISIRNMQSKLKKNYFRDIINQITLKKADKIVTVSNDVKNDIQKRYKVDIEKIITIPNMINFEEIKQKQQEKVEEKSIFENDDIKIINIGRLIPQKGQWHLIKAFKLVTKKYAKAKLEILGRGELEGKLRELVQKLDLQDNVYFMGFKINPYKYLVKSDIFVSTSLYEGMSNVILEAMACRLPIIATDCRGGNKEILKDKYGIIIEAFNEKLDFSLNIDKNEQKLAENIVNLIEDKEKRNHYKKMAFERSRDFDRYIIKQEWKKVIKTII